MITVRDLLKQKGDQVFSISPDSTVFQALQIMAEKDIGALLVMESDQVLGIFSERDYARKIVLKGRTSKESTVGEMMADKVFFIKPDKTINDCMAVMTEKKIRHLPVLENHRLVGLISIGDVVNHVIRSQKTTIADLENYIIGGHKAASI